MQRRRATATLCEERKNTASARTGREAEGVPFLAMGHDGAPSPPGVDLAEPDAPALAGLEQLTPRQIEVLRLVARGMTNNKIAETPFLSRRTGYPPFGPLFHKLAVRNPKTRH